MAEFVKYKAFFALRGKEYSRHFETAEILGNCGLTCSELLNVNFETFKPQHRARANANGYRILKAYAEDVKSMRGEEVDDQAEMMARSAALGLLHEMYYDIISKGRKRSRNLGIDDSFSRAMALEAIAEEYVVCPRCRCGMEGEHLQYRGDMFCSHAGCFGDLDVKTSERGADDHLRMYRDVNNGHAQMKSSETQFVAYMRELAGNYFQFVVLDCESGARVDGMNIPLDLYYHVAWMAKKKVEGRADRIRALV
jgi:hypothetical protein